MLNKNKLNALIDALRKYKNINRVDLKKLIVQHFEVTDIHTVNSYVDVLCAKKFIEVNTKVSPVRVNPSNNTVYKIDLTHTNLESRKSVLRKNQK